MDIFRNSSANLSDDNEEPKVPILEMEEQSEEQPLQDILANKRRNYSTQQEYIYVLYESIRRICIPEWNGRVLRKTMLSKKMEEGIAEAKEKETRVSELFDVDEDLRKNDEAENNVKERTDWRLNLPDEYIEIEFTNKNSYAGRVSRGQMEGEGLYRWQHGAWYKGQFEENHIEGKGYLQWKDISWYEGEFRNGYRHGTGTMVSKENKRLYVGQWNMGRKHGKGYCRYAEEDFYDGDWEMDRRHGVGFRIYPSGARYIGHWQNDFRHGIGTMIWSNGDVYRGEWEDGLMNGYGEYTWNGFFNKTLSWPQENCYMGEWRHGMRHGTGTLKMHSLGGAKYCGGWNEDRKHGYGMIIGNNGNITEADPLFIDNILTPLVPESNIELQNTDEYLVNVNRETYDRVKKQETKQNPRPTSSLKPEQCPSLCYYIYRLLQPERIWPPSAVSIPSGECHVCHHDSKCACLHQTTESTENQSKDSSAPLTTIFTSSSSSTSKFCLNRSEPHDPGKRVSQFSGLKEMQHEKRWVYNCFITHMPRLRGIYQIYAEIYCEEPPKCSLSLSRMALWQLWRDCGIHERGISLVEIDRQLALNKSTLVEETHAPFERIEIWQFLLALLEVSWHLYTKLGDIETEEMRGQLAGGLHRLLINDIFPNALNRVGTVYSINRDLLPLYSVYQLYREVGEPHSAKQLLRSTCIPKGSRDPEVFPWPLFPTMAIPSYLLSGVNAVTIGERMSYLPEKKLLLQPQSPKSAKKYDDHLARELFALRDLGATEMVAVMAAICPAIKDEENDMIVNMDYEFTFLEFYEILLEATKQLIYRKKVIEQKKIKETASVVLRTQSLHSVRSTRQLHRPSKTRKKLTKPVDL